MRVTSKHLRIAANAAVTLVFLPVGGQWFISYAEEKGWYKQPVERAHLVISTMLTSNWFHWIGGIIVGFAIGVWLDAIVSRKDVGTAQPSAADIMATRMRIVSKGRDLVHAFMNSELVNHVGGFSSFLELSREYSDVRPHLSSEYLSKLLNSKNTIDVRDNKDSYPYIVASFLNEMDRLEKQWKLAD